MDAIGDPQRSYPIVHVTGTNGKGSTSRMVAALLEAQGLRVGVYSSPHLEVINERMSIAGEPISDEELASQLGSLAELELFLGERLSWFEIMTASAYRWFADEAVDAAVVEVGLGGRFDATNVADATVAAVTNVALDHTDLLGTTRESIASEKAGIVKSGCVLVLGEQDEEIAAIFEDEAVRVSATSVWRRGDDFGAEDPRLAVGGRVVDLYTPARRYEDVFIPLYGAHQADNAAVALASAQAFSGVPLEADVVEAGFARVTVPGRMQVVRRSPLVVLDGAHNAAGALAAGVTLAEDFAGTDRLLVVMGCLRGREPLELLEGLSAGGRRPDRVIACSPASPRAQPASAVVEAARSLGLEAEAIEPGETSVSDALADAIQLARGDDLVLVTGSLYVVGAALADLRR
jgi:dihydrofolate synthase/folylpolyglutamate synthase